MIKIGLIILLVLVVINNILYKKTPKEYKQKWAEWQNDRMWSGRPPRKILFKGIYFWLIRKSIKKGLSK